MLYVYVLNIYFLDWFNHIEIFVHTLSFVLCIFDCLVFGYHRSPISSSVLFVIISETFVLFMTLNRACGDRILRHLLVFLILLLSAFSHNGVFLNCVYIHIYIVNSILVKTGSFFLLVLSLNNGVVERW